MFGVIYCEPKLDITAAEGAAQGAKSPLEQEDTPSVARSMSAHYTPRMWSVWRMSQFCLIVVRCPMGGKYDYETATDRLAEAGELERADL